MASVQDIKRRVASVKNTRKITKAMELVAAAKLRRAEPRIEALRPYAERMRELMTGTARATPSRGFPLLEERESEQTVGDPAAHGRPRAGRRVQRADAAPLARARARGAGRGQGRPLARGRQEGPLDAPLPPLRDRAGVGRPHRPARLPRRRGDRPRDRGALHEPRGRPRGHGLQPLRLAAHPAVETEEILPIPRTALGDEGEERSAYEIALEGDFIYEPEPERSSSGCCRVPGDDASSGRCSSRPRPSTARG